MEEAELEEGEACFYSNNNDDYDATTDLENDLSSLSYIDEKVQHVLGHFQKDFEGGFSAANLGAKFGGYGSFLPTYTHSHGWPHPKSPPKHQSCNAPRPLKNMSLEDGYRNSSFGVSDSQPRRTGPPPSNFGTLPALKASSAADSIKQEVGITSAHDDMLTFRCNFANKRAANLPDSLTLKVRIKVGSDNLLTQKSAAIYSGLGLDVSPSSSLEESSKSEGMYRETQEQPIFESPVSILRSMTSFPVPGEALLSPLADHLLNFIIKEKIPKGNGSGSGKDDGILLVDKKAKSVEKNDFLAERKSGIMLKKEVDIIDTLACEELVSEILKLPLLSNSYAAVDKVKSKGVTRKKGNHNEAMEDSLEPIFTQEIERENPRDGSSRKVLEEQKTSVLDDILDYAGKDGYSKTDKTYDSVKAVSKTVKGSKALNSESLDPPKQRICQRDASHEQDNMNLPPAKEHNSYGEKGKPKSSQGSLATEVPKESSRVGSSLMLKNKQTANMNNFTNKRESGNKKLERPFQKDEDWYGDSFGDIGESEQEENQTSSLEIRSEFRLKEVHKIEKTTSYVNGAHSDRQSGNKIEDLLATKSYPRTTVDGSSNSANVTAAGASFAAAAPALIIENWVHCDKCQKWRLLPININPADLPEKWLCSMLNWLPGMNHCNVAEEETTKAVFALYQVPAVASLTNLQSNAGNIMSSVALQPEQNQRSSGSHAMPAARRKKHGLKELSNSVDKDGTTPLKKNIQPSVQSGSQNNENQSPVVDEPGLQHPGKYDLPVKKHKNKLKEKQNLLEHSSDGGDTRTSKMKGKRTTEPDSLRASKKIKVESACLADEDRMSEHASKSTSIGFPNTLVGKDHPKNTRRSSYNDSKSDKDRQQFSGKRPKNKVEASLTDGSLDLANCDVEEVSRKRKVDDSINGQFYTGSAQSISNHLQDSRVFEKEELCENDYRRDKKARVSKSGGKDSSTTKSSGTLEKKSRHTKNHQSQSKQDLGSSLSQWGLAGMYSLKRDLGSDEPSLPATSSSPKVSGSHKSEPSFHEIKGSPVESVSSSPMRIANPDKLPSTRMNVTGEDESCDADHFVAGSPRRSSEGGSDGSGKIRKENSSASVQNGSHGSTVLDVIQDKDGDQLGGSKAKAPAGSSHDIRKYEFISGGAHYLGQETQCADKSIIMDEHHNVEIQNDNRGNANVSRPRKSGKGSSQLKGRNRNFKYDSVDEQLNRVPNYEGKPMDGRNKFQDRPGLKSNESVHRFDGDKEAFGKLSGESCKRQNHSNVGRSDAKADATGGSTMKQNLLQDSNGEKYKRRFHFEKYDHEEIPSGRGSSLSLPPAGGTQNKMLTGCPCPVSGLQKGNRADGSQTDDALKVQKQADHQNGSQPRSSRNTASGGFRIRDADAPSSMRKESSSQAATNALKEAKDLKHLADRLKNSGSNVESTALYFQAALKFLHSASLLESGNSESNKHGEMIQSVQMYSSTAKLCEFCAHEYERLKDMASASLAYKCMEVAYMRVIYSSHANVSRDGHELQSALQMVPPGESPSSSASDVDNLNHPTKADKVAFPKGLSSPQVAGNHVISARNRPSFVRLLNFAQDINHAMEASRKSQSAFTAAGFSLGGAECGEAITSVKKALDCNFQDVEGVLRLVRVAMEAINNH